MKIIKVLEKTVPIQSSIRNSYIDFSEMTAGIVAIITDYIVDGQPVVGYGFNSNGRYGQGSLMRERLIPRIISLDESQQINENGDNLDPFKLWDAMMSNEKPGGHGERAVAVGTLDMAIWDAVGKIANKPLWKYLADEYNNGKYDERVFVYAAGGYYEPDKGIKGLQEEIKKYLDSGFDVVKIKVGGAEIDSDKKRIEASLMLLESGNKLAVDANGRFDLKQALAFGEMIEPYKLRWYEEPGDPLDFELNAILAEQYSLSLATGENLLSMQDARNLIRYAGLRSGKDILQFDPALSYGLVEYMRIIKMLESSGWSRRACIPHGGHLMALNIASGLCLGGNEAYPGVFEPFGGFFDGFSLDNSGINLQQNPGIGFEGKKDLILTLRSLFK